ncbi:MAG: hypothetical protein IPL32_03135 [Chloracidobacterium sp.]|nr:hypothetical protein [Chloracidobacterium sp.]
MLEIGDAADQAETVDEIDDIAKEISVTSMTTSTRKCNRRERRYQTKADSKMTQKCHLSRWLFGGSPMAFWGVIDGFFGVSDAQNNVSY